MLIHRNTLPWTVGRRTFLNKQLPDVLNCCKFARLYALLAGVLVVEAKVTLYFKKAVTGHYGFDIWVAQSIGPHESHGTNVALGSPVKKDYEEHHQLEDTHLPAGICFTALLDCAVSDGQQNADNQQTQEALKATRDSACCKLCWPSRSIECCLWSFMIRKVSNFVVEPHSAIFHLLCGSRCYAHFCNFLFLLREGVDMHCVFLLI